MKVLPYQPKQNVVSFVFCVFSILHSEFVSHLPSIARIAYRVASPTCSKSVARNLAHPITPGAFPASSTSLPAPVHVRVVLLILYRTKTEGSPFVPRIPVYLLGKRSFGSKQARQRKPTDGETILIVSLLYLHHCCSNINNWNHHFTVETYFSL
jgi:hypothetical protein